MQNVISDAAATGSVCEENVVRGLIFVEKVLETGYNQRTKTAEPVALALRLDFRFLFAMITTCVRAIEGIKLGSSAAGLWKWAFGPFFFIHFPE